MQLTGPEAGRWADFADGGGRGQAHGDLIDLWRMRKGISTGEALAEIKAYLGIADPAFTRPKETKTYTRPKPPKDAQRAARGTRVEHYLRTERGLMTETTKAFGVAEAAVRIGKREDGSESRFQGPWILFPYLRREAGKVVTTNIKWLHLERRDGKKITLQEKGAQPGLFGWHLVPDAARAAVIVEGEIDAMTVHQWGYVGLSVPEGAGGGKKLDWIEHDWERLEQFETIYLCYDQDDVGQATIEEAAGRLGRHRCRRVKLPEKDPNDCLIKCAMTAEEFQACIEGAEDLAPATLANAADFREEVLEEFFAESTEKLGWAMPFPAMHGFRLRLGEVTILTGWNGSGKSLLAGQWVNHNIGQGVRACVASMEMLPRKTIARQVKQALAVSAPTRPEVNRVIDWLDGNLWIYNVRGTTKPDQLLPDLLYARRRYNCRFFVVDSLMRCGIGEDDYDAQKDFILSLCTFAEQELVHVVLIAHARKGADESKAPGKMDVKGTSAITDNAYNVLSLFRNKPKEAKLDRLENDKPKDAGTLAGQLADAKALPDAYLICDKQRHHPWEGRIRLWFDAGSLLYRDVRDGGPPRLAAREMMRDAPVAPPTLLDDGVDGFPV